MTPLKDFGSFHPINAPLTEQAVVAYEWGYACDHPNNLAIWEAQFGDFWNQAEVSVDTLVTCGEFKKRCLSSLDSLLKFCTPVALKMFRLKADKNDKQTQGKLRKSVLPSAYNRYFLSATRLIFYSLSYT